MAALVEMIVQKISDAAPIEDTVSNFVAGVLENTANKLARFDAAPSDPDVATDDDAA